MAGALTDVKAAWTAIWVRELPAACTPERIAAASAVAAAQSATPADAAWTDVSKPAAAAATAPAPTAPPRPAAAQSREHFTSLRYQAYNALGDHAEAITNCDRAAAAAALAELERLRGTAKDALTDVVRNGAPNGPVFDEGTHTHATIARYISSALAESRRCANPAAGAPAPTAPPRPAAANSREHFTSLRYQAFNALGDHAEAITNCDRPAAAAALAELERLRSEAKGALADVVRIGGPRGPIFDEGTYTDATIDRYVVTARAQSKDCAEPASPAPSGSNPPAPGVTIASAQLARRLEMLVAHDARGWSSNRYTAGSMTNVTVVEGAVASGTFALRGEYRFNRNSKGWVIARFRNAGLHCLQYHDIGKTCRPLNTP